MNSYSPLLVCLGDWKITLFPYTANFQYVLDIQRHFPQFIFSNFEFDNSIEQLFILSATEVENVNAQWWAKENVLSKVDHFFTDLKIANRRYWRAHSQGLTGTARPKDFFIFSSSRQIYNCQTNFVNKYGGKEFSDNLHALIFKNTDQNTYIQITLYLLHLAARWHIMHGGLFIHSSGVANHHSLNNGFLFLGESGYGKTTVAQFGIEVGNAPLGDDLNFIMKDHQGGYKIMASPSVVSTLPRYSMLQPSLKGIFKLVKDDHDELIRLSPKVLARTLFDGIKQTPKVSSLSDQVFMQAFQTISRISNNVPGYELHFRKSLNFWKLIDEQFPD